MKVRDYTDATKQRLLRQINKIENDSQAPLLDAVGDAVLKLGKWTNILHIYDDMSNVKSYHRHVLDMTDMSKKQLNKIFEKVYSTDNKYKRQFKDLNTREKMYNKKLLELSEMINPYFTILSAAEIKSRLKDINKQMENLDDKIYKDFGKEVALAEKDTLVKGFKGLVSSLITGVVDICTYPVNMTKNIIIGNYAGVVSDAWGLVNDVFGVGSNLIATAGNGFLYVIAALTNDTANKEYVVEQSRPYAGKTTLAGALEADAEINNQGWFEKTLYKGATFLDTVNTAYSLTTSLKSFVQKPSDMIDIKLGFKTKLKGVTKAEMTKKFAKNYRKYQKIYRHLGKHYHYVALSNIKNGYKYVKNIYEGKFAGGLDTAMESAFKPYKWIKDGSDFIFDKIPDVWKTITG